MASRSARRHLGMRGVELVVEVVGHLLVDELLEQLRPFGIAGLDQGRVGGDLLELEDVAETLGRVLARGQEPGLVAARAMLLRERRRPPSRSRPWARRRRPASAGSAAEPWAEPASPPTRRPPSHRPSRARASSQPRPRADPSPGGGAFGRWSRGGDPREADLRRRGAGAGAPAGGGPSAAGAGGGGGVPGGGAWAASSSSSSAGSLSTWAAPAGPRAGGAVRSALSVGPRRALTSGLTGAAAPVGLSAFGEGRRGRAARPRRATPRPSGPRCGIGCGISCRSPQKAAGASGCDLVVEASRWSAPRV